MFTTEQGLPLAVATADCVPVIVEGDAVTAVIHAGWRGVASGVVPATLAAIEAAGLLPARAAIGPSIGPCCYEVGEELLDLFPRHRSSTNDGAFSVDLGAAVAEQLGGLAVWRSPACTSCDEGLHSFRQTRTAARQVSVAWIPTT